ncbi:MAG: response regulator [Gammaproteobacteria bacterium]|nr:response regulator [Gammaproteobacteria bacterium]
MHWYGKEFSIPRLHFWLLLTVLGTLANTMVVDLPFVVPLSLGNVALFLIALRLGTAWALPAACFILLPLYQNLALATSLLQLMLILLFNSRIRRYSIRAVCLDLILGVALLSQLAPAEISNDLMFLAMHAGLSAAVFAFCLRAMLIFDSLTPSVHRQLTQSLSQQLSHRVAMYSSIPSTLLIALILHGATALDLSRHLLRYKNEQYQLSEQIGQRLTGYLTQVSLAARILQDTTPNQLLPALTSQMPEYISALVTDARGNVLSFYKKDAPGPAQSGSNVADRSYFSEPRRTGQPFVSDTFLGRTLGEDQLFAVSTILAGAQHHADFKGVLEVSVNLQQLTSAITPTDNDISHRVLLDREQKKIWGTADDRPLGQLWSVGSPSDPMPRQFMRYSWFNTFGPISLTQNSSHLLLVNNISPSQWQLKYFIDTEFFVKRYHMFLTVALLLALLLLESIAALSRAFITRYTKALEQLATSATSWQPDAPPQTRPTFQQSATEIEMLAGTIHDMQSRVSSSRIAMQKSMQQIVTFNNELEQRVQNRTEELELERDKANQLASIKTRFLANMSHEIRTPITVIKGFTEQLLLKIQGPDALLMRRIQQNTEHLQRLVDDILDTAKIDEGKMRLDLQHFHLHTLISSVTDSIEALATQKGLRLIVQLSAAEELMVWADPFRLKQILLNFLSNAIKFTKTGEIRVELQRLPDASLQISVVDQGVGIAPEQLPLLFKAFSQADTSTSRHFGGTGLGLYISQQLAEAMQLQISVQSTQDEGSSFNLLIPAALLSHAVPFDSKPLETERTTTEIPAARLLIVDDVADIRALLASYLAEHPLTLSFAADGRAAVQQCQQHTFDLIIMDQQMPELDGLQATQAIRAMGIKTPVLSLSADVFEEPDKIVAGLFQKTMTKPFERKALLAAIAALLTDYPPAPYIKTPSSPTASQVSEPVATIEDDDLTTEYRRSLAAQAQQLNQLWRDADWPAFKILLHKIKGTSACFGFTQISEQAATLGQQLKHDVPAEQELEQLIQALTKASL